MKLVAFRPPLGKFEPQAVTDHLGNVANVRTSADFDGDDRQMLCRVLRNAREQCAPWERFAIDRLVELLGK